MMLVMLFAVTKAFQNLSDFFFFFPVDCSGKSLWQTSVHPLMSLFLVFVLQDMKRPFQPMKALDMEKVISDIVDGIK